METDVTKVLTYEIKKELADRYFGFRKIIEEDKEDLQQKVHYYTRSIVQKICFDLVRLYMLLKDRELIRAFLDLAGMEEEIFYDPYFSESMTLRAKVFQGLKSRGLTRGARFKNLVFDSYEELVRHVGEYREIFGELLEFQEMINEEIKIFYQKHDISNIMGFLRSLDTAGQISGLDTGIERGFDASMQKKMKVGPPEPIEQDLPVMPPLVPLPHIRSKLKKIVEKALKLHHGEFHIPRVA